MIDYRPDIGLEWWGYRSEQDMLLLQGVYNLENISRYTGCCDAVLWMLQWGTWTWGTEDGHCVSQEVAGIWVRKKFHPDDSSEQNVWEGLETTTKGVVIMKKFIWPLSSFPGTQFLKPLASPEYRSVFVIYDESFLTIPEFVLRRLLLEGPWTALGWGCSTEEAPGD